MTSAPPPPPSWWPAAATATAACRWNQRVGSSGAQCSFSPPPPVWWVPFWGLRPGGGEVGGSGGVGGGWRGGDEGEDGEERPYACGNSASFVSADDESATRGQSETNRVRSLESVVFRGSGLGDSWLLLLRLLLPLLPLLLMLLLLLLVLVLPTRRLPRKTS
ncbi:hypothetical protein DFJ73DRAFT_842689 [Zopfochytrium polystomum]|nr:hypothetical protein DFJ73DRAFT_842689 [Zopfochytrium polystomum]